MEIKSIEKLIYSETMITLNNSSSNASKWAPGTDADTPVLRNMARRSEEK